MKIDLYGKKIGLPGAVFLNTVEVPDDFGPVYKVPVRSSPKVKLMTDEVEYPAHEFESREFHYQHNPLQKLLGQNKAYVEI